MYAARMKLVTFKAPAYVFFFVCPTFEHSYYFLTILDRVSYSILLVAIVTAQDI
jgi:hypothetical protein